MPSCPHRLSFRASFAPLFDVAAGCIEQAAFYVAAQGFTGVDSPFLLRKVMPLAPRLITAYHHVKGVMLAGVNQPLAPRIEIVILLTCMLIFQRDGVHLPGGSRAPRVDHYRARDGGEPGPGIAFVGKRRPVASDAHEHLLQDVLSVGYIV